MKNNYKDFLIIIISLLFLYFSLLNNKIINESIISSITLWVTKVFPSLFPMILLNNILIDYNLPYYITTPIIFRLLEINVNIEKMVFMVQKEVALRLTGKPNTKDYNSLSVLINYKAKANLEFSVGRNCFMPSPDVESAVILLSKIKSDYAPNNEAKFINYIRDLFAMRRKTILNNISCKYTISKDKIKESLIKCGLKESARAEELDLKKIIELYEALGLNE